MSKKKGNKKEVEATEFEVLAAMVANLDKIKRIQGKDSANYKKQHELAVRKVELLNREFGKGFTNLSDVRNINTIQGSKGYAGVVIINSRA